MDDLGVDPMLHQPPSQPKSVTPGFKSDCDALDSPPFSDRLIAPPVQDVQQCLFVGCDLLQRLPVESRHASSDQPT
jgi:hypothetical protein